MSFFPDQRTTARVVAVLVVGTYVVVGAMAALWWLDEETPWPVAAFMYAFLWAFTFSEITRVGPQTFFRETRFLTLKVAFLALVGAVFSLGFFFAD